ncbi:MAG: hypothetical protein LBO77_05565 [Desulfovibrio sp.]|nr:hypothetical protein [Desulfovibrio sp.]
MERSKVNGGRRIPLWAGALCVLLLLVRTITAHAQSGGPLDALVLVQQGIDTRNPDLFHQAVDLNAVLSHALDDALRILNTQAGSLDTTLALALQGLEGDSSLSRNLFSALLSSEAQRFVDTGIRSGSFAGKTPGQQPFSSLLLQGVSQERKQIIPGKILSRQGVRATASASLADDGAGIFPLRLALEEENGHWRIKKILNIPELIKEAMVHGR